MFGLRTLVEEEWLVTAVGGALPRTGVEASTAAPVLLFLMWGGGDDRGGGIGHGDADDVDGTNARAQATAMVVAAESAAVP